MPSHPDWQLVFVLPNLCLGQHERSPSELTLGLEGIAIVPTSDPRVTEIAEGSSAARRFLGSFHDGYGKAVKPAVLIVRQDWHSDVVGEPEPVIAFRNAAAVASILPCRARWLDDGWSGVSWSESFDYHPAQLRLDGTKFDFSTPALESIGLPLDGLSLTPDLCVPRTELSHMDERLAERFGRLWHLRYRRGREKRKSARVFRSLETAYEALGIRFRNYSSLNEVGLNCVPWTTAIEVLASPEQGSVKKWHCTRLIGRHEFSHPRLKRRKCWVKTKQGRRHMTVAQKIFLRLYDARSKFVHGDSVSVNLLLSAHDDAPSVLSLASTIYRTALIAYMDNHWPNRLSPIDPGYIDVASWDYEDHLLKAIGESSGV